VFTIMPYEPRAALNQADQERTNPVPSYIP